MIHRDSDPPPAAAALRTNRDLYRHVVAEGRRMTAAGRTLEQFLRAWWGQGRAMADRAAFDLDTVAAMITAAGTVRPPEADPAWSERSWPWVSEPTSFFDWEAVVLSQIADLADLAAEGPLGEYAEFGTTVQRPAGCTRATDTDWYNFTPHAYLECGMAGALGGWSSGDGTRVAVPGPVNPLAHHPGEALIPLSKLAWADLARLAIYGQIYE